MEFTILGHDNIILNVNFNFVSIRWAYLPFACLAHSIGFDFP